MTMTRTTVYLTQDAKRRLSAAAHRRHRSEAELIRDAIDQLLADEPERPRPHPPQLNLDPAVIDNVDEHLFGGVRSGQFRGRLVAQLIVSTSGYLAGTTPRIPCTTRCSRYWAASASRRSSRRS